MASGGIDGFVRLWDPATGAEVRRTKTGHLYYTESVTYLADGEGIAASSHGDIVRLWDAATGRERLALVLDRPEVNALAFAPDGKALAAACRDGHVGVFEAVADPSKRTHSVISYGEDGQTRVSDVGTAKELRRLEGPGHQGCAVAFSPDGRVLAAGGGDGAAHLWETATWRQRRVLPGHGGAVTALAFLPGEGRLISASADTTALVWDVSAAGARRGAGPTRHELAGLWEALGDEDAAKGYDALAALAASPKEGVPFLRERLTADAPDPKRVAQLIADLDADEFAVRERASAELEKLGPEAAPLLRQALGKAPTAEVRQRLERVLARIDETRLTPQRLRQLRAVEVLEGIGTAEAREALGALAKGAPGARLTREAEAALKRLGK